MEKIVKHVLLQAFSKDTVVLILPYIHAVEIRRTIDRKGEVK